MAKSITNKSTGRFISIPFVVLKSEDYRNLKPYAVKLLTLMLMQYNGKNNGDLNAAWSTMSEYGFRSKGTLKRSLQALLDADLILKTREAYFQHPNNRCALYAVTWKPIDECPGKHLDMKATVTPPRKFSLEKQNTRSQNGTQSDLKTGHSKQASDLKTGHSDKASDLKMVAESAPTESQNSTPTNLPRDSRSLGSERTVVDLVKSREVRK